MIQEIINILYSALGVIVTGLVSFAVAKLTQWINGKISDRKAANYLSTVASLVLNGVKEVYQTYVEALKNQGSFGKEAQLEALNRCLAKVKSQLVPEVQKYIVDNFGDLDEYLKGLIESTIYSLKK